MDKTSTILIRIAIGLFMTAYFAVWAFGFYGLSQGMLQEEGSCGTANGFTLIILFGVWLVYFIVSLLLFLFTAGQLRQDFKITLGLVLLPIIIGGVGWGFIMVRGLLSLF